MTELSNWWSFGVFFFLVIVKFHINECGICSWKDHREVLNFDTLESVGTMYDNLVIQIVSVPVIYIVYELYCSNLPICGVVQGSLFMPVVSLGARPCSYSCARGYPYTFYGLLITLLWTLNIVHPMSGYFLWGVIAYPCRSDDQFSCENHTACTGHLYSLLIVNSLWHKQNCYHFKNNLFDF